MSVDPQPLRLLLDTLGRDGRQFERLVKWFLSSDPEFRAQFREVWLWHEWPDRWGPDRGIDLIACTHEGALVAVQAKNYHEAHTVTKADMDTFLTESNRVEISERLLIASTDRVARSARQVMREQEKPVASCLLTRLCASPVTWPTTIQQLRPETPAAAIPRPHQREALANIDRWAQSATDRGQVIMACGTGKTLVGILAADQLGAERVLVLVPTIALLRQMAVEWSRHAASARRLLRICSDSSRLDENLVHDDELSATGTTDPARIAETVGRAGPVLVLCTYDSSPTLARACTETGADQFDLVIADEAHRCAGLERAANKTVLDGEVIRARRRLFFTATPTVYGTRDRGRLRHRNVSVASMDDPVKFGPVIHRLSFAEAIEQGLLCPYQVVVIPISDEEVHAMIEQRVIVTADGDHTLEARSLATQIACARAMRRYGCQRIVAFHRSIPESKRFTEHFPIANELLPLDQRSENPVWAAHVDGDRMPLALRHTVLRRFQFGELDESRLLSNVRLLTEGVDVPGIDAIAFVDTHRGHNAIVQAVGRAVRPSAGKQVGTILLPIVLRKDEAFGAALARSEHRHIVDILGALKSHDPDIGRSLDQLRFRAGEGHPPPRATGGFVVDAPSAVGDEFAAAVQVALATALDVPALAPRRGGTKAKVPRNRRQSRSDEATFLIGLQTLREYRAYQLLPRLPSDTGFPLAAWWAEVKRRWHAGTLDPAHESIIADNLSWLSAHDFAPGDRALRARLIQISQADLAEQFGSQLLPEGCFAEEFAPLLENKSELPGLTNQLRDVHERIGHAAMSHPIQAIYLAAALRPLARAIETAREGPLPPAYYWLTRRESAIRGFLHGLRAPNRPARSPLDLPTPQALYEEVEDAWAHGERASLELTRLVAAMAPYRYVGDADDVARRRLIEHSLHPNERLDAIGWDIFLLARARYMPPGDAAHLAMNGPLASRCRVRTDLLGRARRALASPT
ncbi:MAG: DEAD/DEAH box helicase family protein [Actinomycetota bacterium]|nr:DEAD/DEAH box helicase family protein [Actinomycetota bacterium]